MEQKLQFFPKTKPNLTNLNQCETVTTLPVTCHKS